MNALRDVAKQAIVMPFRSENDAELVTEVDATLSAPLPSIATAGDYEAAADTLKGLARVVKRIGEFFDDDIAAAHKIHKSLTGKKRLALEKVEARISALKRLMGDYVQAQERERQRLEREAQAAAKQAEEERITREAAALEAAGDHATAAAVVEEALATPAAPVHVPSSVQKVTGIATVESWDFEILNEKLIPREYLAVDLVKIRGVVRSLKDGARIPGVKVIRRTNVRVSA